MAMTVTELTERVNLLINRAISAGLTVAQIQSALTTQSTAIGTANPKHSREIEEPGVSLNPSQP